MKTKVHSIIFVIALLVSSPAQAMQLHVPQEYLTIQSALDACQSMDTIWVSPGNYYENISWPDKAGIKLFATGKASNTIIDGSGQGMVISFNFPYGSSIDLQSEIRGFTITHGKGLIYGTYPGGGAMYFDHASPKITHCIIAENRSVGDGTTFYGFGAVYAIFSSPKFRYTGFVNNLVDSVKNVFGGLVHAYEGDVVFDHCYFLNNTLTSSSQVHGGILHFEQHSMTVRSCVMMNNNFTINDLNAGNGIMMDGGGDNTHFHMENSLVAKNTVNKASLENTFVLYNGGAAFEIINCTITGNTTLDGSFLRTLTTSGDAPTTITNCIFWNTIPEYSSEIDGPLVTVTYSDIRNGYEGTGNIDADPLFISKKDFHLQSLSPCINSGTNEGVPEKDLEGNDHPSPAGTNADMGCYEMNQILRIADYGATQSSIEIYPNPTTNNLSVEYFSNSADDVEFNIYDVNGKVVFNQMEKMEQGLSATFEFHLADLMPGIYLLEARNGMEVNSKKFVRLR